MGIKNFFKKKKAKLTGSIYNNVIYTNNHVDLVHDTCKLCYNRDTENTKEGKLKYIAGKIKDQHESILEHSNFVTYYIFDKNNTPEDLADFLTNCKYLNVKTRQIKEELHMLIGGSIRGYKHIVRAMINQNNKFLKSVKTNMYFINKEYFVDFVEDNVMDEMRFNDAVEVQFTKLMEPVTVGNLDVINVDDIKYIHDAVNGIFSYEDLLDICTITVRFNNVSRIISQQITRHRNAITQLSQRYVDYSSDEFGFNSPAMFKPEKYDKDKRYQITFSTHKEDHDTALLYTSMLTLQELGDTMMAVYPQLIAQGLLKEDARAYLPNNAQTTLYMTLTFTNTIKFLQLRTNKHAQAEIQVYANWLKQPFSKVIDDVFGKDMYSLIEPKYKVNNLEEVDYYASIDEQV